jgi:SAM-dependent methyltransferase
MDELARQYLISFYDRALQMFGDRPEALRWTSDGQILHYESLLDIGVIHGKKVLDFGCGKGDFLRFLKERDIQLHYTGFDINEKLIGMAREKNPGARFRVFDIERDTMEEDFDYIFLCGVFNLKFQGIDEMIRDSLRKLFERCRTGLAFNALSSHNPKKDSELHYVSPEDLFTFAIKNLTPFISIRHDRLHYDFNMFLYKERNSFS